MNETTLTSSNKDISVLFYPFSEGEGGPNLASILFGDMPSYDLSIIVAFFNASETIIESLRSLLPATAALRVQLICVDDGSTDDSLKLVSSFLRDQKLEEAIIVKQPNRGPAAARNAGLQFCRGEYVGSLDSDDIANAVNYATLVQFARDYACDVVWGRTETFSNDLIEKKALWDFWIWDDLLAGRSSSVISPRTDSRPYLIDVQPNARLIRGEFLKGTGIRYEESIFIGEDVSFHNACLRQSERVGFVDLMISNYRQARPAQLTAERSERRFGFIEVFSSELAKMKQQPHSEKHLSAFMFELPYKMFWCGQILPLSMRQRFFEVACNAYSEVPSDWTRLFFAHYSRSEKAFVLWCLSGNRARALSDLAAGKRLLLQKVFFIVQIQGTKELLLLVFRSLIRKADHLRCRRSGAH